MISILAATVKTSGAKLVKIFLSDNQMTNPVWQFLNFARLVKRFQFFAGLKFFQFWRDLMRGQDISFSLHAMPVSRQHFRRRGQRFELRRANRSLPRVPGTVRRFYARAPGGGAQRICPQIFRIYATGDPTGDFARQSVCPETRRTAPV
jgi:hypothetical protein